MAFVKVNKARQVHANADVSEIVMGAYVADGKNFKGKSIGFRLTAALMRELGWEVVDRRVKIAVSEGTGEDTGFLQLSPDPHGYTAVQGKHKEENSDTINNLGLSFAVTHDRMRYYVLNECPMSAIKVNHMIDNGLLIVECPDWLRPNLTQMERDGVGAKPKPLPEPEPIKQPMNRQTRRMLGKEISRALR